MMCGTISMCISIFLVILRQCALRLSKFLPQLLLEMTYNFISFARGSEMMRKGKALLTTEVMFLMFFWKLLLHLEEACHSLPPSQPMQRSLKR